MSTFSLILPTWNSTTIAVLAAIETMSDISSDLEQLRRRIDEIDDRLQDLLIERMEIVSRVAAHKRGNGNVAAHQPAREAEIIRRLVARNHGEFPPATVVRMWRELLAATTRLQGAVCDRGLCAARGAGHLGHRARPLRQPYADADLPLDCAGHPSGDRRQAAVGVLPMPEEDERDPWWRHLLSTHHDAPRVIARLPFGARGNARSDSGDALAIGHGGQQQTGRDRTLIATENAPDISRGRMFATLAGLGFACTFMASCEHAEGANTLIEIDGFVPMADPRLERLRARLGPDLLPAAGGSAATPCRSPPPNFAAADLGRSDAGRHRRRRGERLSR